MFSSPTREDTEEIPETASQGPALLTTYLPPVSETREKASHKAEPDTADEQFR